METIKVYAERFGDYKMYNEKADTFHGVYLHGKLNDERPDCNDLVFIEKGKLDTNKEQVRHVVVVYPEGTEVDAWLYYWKDTPKCTWEKDIFGNEYPCYIAFPLYHGLVCAIDDMPYNKDAIIKFNMRRNNCSGFLAEEGEAK